MFYAIVETDTGDIFRVILPNGTTGGKAALSLLTGLSIYCADSANEEFSWFRTIEGKVSQSLCSAADTLLNAYYSGEWEYKEDEYDIFRVRSPDMPISEEQFITIIRQVREKWKELPLLICNVIELARILKMIDPSPSPWYQPHHTLMDLDALVDTLKLALERGAEKARINFL